MLKERTEKIPLMTVAGRLGADWMGLISGLLMNLLKHWHTCVILILRFR